jgi:broad specificity phosphatase PhoE
MADRAILTIVRHGETSANLTGVWHGSTDTPLTERGRRQAERVAAHLAASYADATALYTSPLERARHTAEAIARALGLELRLEPGLREYDLGSWEQKTYRELLEEHQLWQNQARDPDFAPHGGESARDVVARFRASLERIEAAHGGERVILVTHGGALALALAALLRGRVGEWYDPMANCALSELVLTPRPELLRFNEAGHLEGV